MVAKKKDKKKLTLLDVLLNFRDALVFFWSGSGWGKGRKLSLKCRLTLDDNNNIQEDPSETIIKSRVNCDSKRNYLSKIIDYETVDDV